jgi:hypothetical protein
MKKKLLLFLALLFSLAISGTYIYAQSTQVFKSNAVITKVGNAPDSEKPNISSPGSGVAASCPIPGGKITTPSYQADPQRGHCGGGYGFSCSCGTNGRRAKAIDVSSNGQAVILPQIAGHDVSWKLITNAYPVEGGEGGGAGYTFQAVVGSDKWYLDMLHLGNAGLISGKEYPSGTKISAPVIDHLHMTIGKNIKEPVSAGSDSDCDSGWLPSDFVCQ